MKIVYVFSFFIGAIALSCSFDKFPAVPPVQCTAFPDSVIVKTDPVSGVSDTTRKPYQFRFTHDVRPILEAHCYGCHQSPTQPRDLDYTNFSIFLREAEEGSVVEALRHEQGVVAMPKDAPQLEECQIYAIEKWVEQGAPNN